MTRYLITIAMAILLAGLGAYVYWIELPTERTKTETETTRESSSRSNNKKSPASPSIPKAVMWRWLQKMGVGVLSLRFK